MWLAAIARADGPEMPGIEDYIGALGGLLAGSDALWNAAAISRAKLREPDGTAEVVRLSVPGLTAVPDDALPLGFQAVVLAETRLVGTRARLPQFAEVHVDWYGRPTHTGRSPPELLAHVVFPAGTGFVARADLAALPRHVAVQSGSPIVAHAAVNADYCEFCWIGPYEPQILILSSAAGFAQVSLDGGTAPVAWSALAWPSRKDVGMSTFGDVTTLADWEPIAVPVELPGAWYLEGNDGAILQIAPASPTEALIGEGVLVPADGGWRIQLGD